MITTPQKRRAQGPAVTEVLGTQQISLRPKGGAASTSQQNPGAGGPNQRPMQPNARPNPQEFASAKSGFTPPNQTEKTYAEKEAAYTNIELPSKFQFYQFQSLAARTLKGAEQAKFNRAHQEDRLRFTVEAISATLEPGISAFDLTPSDFYFLMYWQRVASFTKTPQIITLQCDNQEHLEKVAAKEMTVDSLKISEFLNSTTLDVSILENLNFEQLTMGLEAYPLGVETMHDVVALTEKIQDLDSDETLDSEYGWLASKAAFLNRSLPLEQRIEIIKEMSVDDTALLETYINNVTNYGVSEYGTVKCRGCGASKKVKISFDALSFLPGS